MSVFSELRTVIENVRGVANPSDLDSLPLVEVVSKKHIPGTSRECVFRLISHPHIHIKFTWTKPGAHVIVNHDIQGMTPDETLGWVWFNIAPNGTMGTSHRVDSVITRSEWVQFPTKRVEMTTVVPYLEMTIEGRTHRWIGKIAKGPGNKTVDLIKRNDGNSDIEAYQWNDIP